MTASPVLAYIGLGANLGDAPATLKKAIQALGELAQTELCGRSAFYRSAPIDASGPDFINAVVALRTGLDPHALLEGLHAIEAAHGRERPYPNAPRTLDLDLLLYGQQRLDIPTLTVPHPRMQQRAFVLVPLAELAPVGLLIPGQGALNELLAAVADQHTDKLEGDSMKQTPLPERAAPEALGFTTTGLDRLSAAMNEQIARKRLPGVVAMIVRKGKLAYYEALGQRDPKQGDAMRPDSLFRIYSMTKPVVSVAVMMLFDQGRLFLTDPVHKYLPEFKDTPVGVVRSGVIEHVPAERAMTVQDLLRHTSGLTYEILAEAPIRKLYARAKIYRRDWTNEDFTKALAGLPLMYQPGAVWDYSRATDVLGRIVEVVSGQPLHQFFAEHIFGPLGMVDTGFHVPTSEHGRLAEPFAKDPDSGADVQVLEVREPVAMDMGGGGLVSTTADYARFCQMMLNGGVLDGKRLLSRTTVALMTADHLGNIPSVNDLLPPGHGFGLGFAVRLQAGISPVAGSAGLYFWGGMAGTTFFIDPSEDMYAILMVQAPGQRDEVRALFRNLVYAALAD